MNEEKTINEALGVSNERADIISCLILATVFFAFKRQDEADEKDNNVCEGIEEALKLVDIKEEVYLLGNYGEQLIDKINSKGTDDFKDWIKGFHEEGDTIETLKQKLYKDKLRVMEEDSDIVDDNLLD